MNITEKEAAGKWCPFVRYHGTPSDDTNSSRDGMFDPAPTCIGSSCMAWRETAEYRADTNQETIKGHCGLAGSP